MRDKTKGWDVIGETPDRFHVLPVWDQQHHVVSEDCGCRPKVREEPRKNGTYGYVITHNSWDGREKHEGVTTDE